MKTKRIKAIESPNNFISWDTPSQGSQPLKMKRRAENIMRKAMLLTSAFSWIKEIVIKRYMKCHHLFKFNGKLNIKQNPPEMLQQVVRTTEKQQHMKSGDG